MKNMACEPEQTKVEFTLYVTNLPFELNEEGLLEIFKYYGVVTGYFIRPRWAYITYNSYGEAESAIRDLNNKPPLRLKVAFGKQISNEVEHNETSLCPISNHEKEQETCSAKTLNKSMMPTVEKTKPLDVVNKRRSDPGLMKQVTENNGLLNRLCKNADPYESSNALWTRGRLTVTPDGKRHVSLGRGYTMYDIPGPNPQIDDHISKVYEKRIFGIYEYGKDELQSRVGNCQVCKKLTKFYCERCHTFYCSKTCQLTDWPKHKIACEAIPALVTSVHSMPVELEPHKQEQSPSRRLSNISAPPRQLKKLSDAMKNSNVSSDENNGLKDVNDKPDVAFIANNLRAKLAKEQSMRKQDEIEKTTVPIQNCDKTSLDKRAVNENENPKESNTCENKWKNMEEDISFQKDVFLSDSKFTDVRIIISENREYWVQKLENEGDLQKFMISLQQDVLEAQKVKPVIGRIYAVKYDNIWHRAIIKSFNPIIVHYLDYGNDDTVDSDDFREISDKLKYKPKFAAKIRLTEKAYEMMKELKSEDIMSVKVVSIDSDETINVEVKGEKDLLTLNDQKADSKLCNIPIPPKTMKTLETPASVNRTSSVVNKLKNVISTVAVGETGVLEIQSKLKDGLFAITLLPNNAFIDYAQILNDLPRKCSELAKNTNYKPNMGDLICGVRRGTIDDWLRGYVLSPSEMAVLDEAVIVSFHEAVVCPTEYRNICAFGVLCELADTEHELIETKQYTFQIARVEQDEVEIKIYDQEIIKANVKPWRPLSRLQNSTLEFAQLKSGDRVVISSYRSPIHYFVRSLSNEEIEYFSTLMQRVGVCAQKSQTLEQLPVVGQMVLAQYSDNNFYRAIATKVQDEENITISYVDFGNIESTCIKKLKVISEDLIQLRSCSSKIILKDVPNDIPLTKEVSEYLMSLIAKDVPLVCRFDGMPCTDGVYLEDPNKESVNKKITELLIPTYKRTPDEKVCYMSSDLDVVPLGSVGNTIQVLVLYVINECYQYAMCPYDHDLIVHVYDAMPKMIAEYCEANEYYIPRDNELCLAAYLNGWYRAVCETRNYSATSSSVFFVDFGNTEVVPHKDIRLMPKDFITPNAMANICNVVNAAPTTNGRYPPQTQEKIKKLIVPDNVLTVKIVRFDDKTGHFDVELPSM